MLPHTRDKTMKRSFIEPHERHRGSLVPVKHCQATIRLSTQLAGNNKQSTETLKWPLQAHQSRDAQIATTSITPPVAFFNFKSLHPHTMD